MKRRFCYLVRILHRIVVCRTSLFFFLLSSSFSFFPFLFFFFLRRPKVTGGPFYSCWIVICRAPFRFLCHSKVPGCHCTNPSFPSMAAGSPGAIRAWGSLLGLEFGGPSFCRPEEVVTFCIESFLEGWDSRWELQFLLCRGSLCRGSMYLGHCLFFNRR